MHTINGLKIQAHIEQSIKECYSCMAKEDKAVWRIKK